MTQLGDIIETRVVFYIEYSRKGADDWFRSGIDADSVSSAIIERDELMKRREHLEQLDYRVVRETTIAEVVKL